MELNATGQELAMTSKTGDGRPFIPECELVYEGGSSSENLFCECKKNPGHPTFIPVNALEIKHLPPEFRTPECMEYIQCKCDLTMKVNVNCTSPERPETYPDGTTPYPYSEIRGSHRGGRCGTAFFENYRGIRPKSKQCTAYFLAENMSTIHDVTHDDSAVSKVLIQCFDVKRREIAVFEKFKGIRGVKGETCPCPPCKESDHPKTEYFIVTVTTATHVIYDDIEASKAVFECFYDSNDKEGVKCLYGRRVLNTDAPLMQDTDRCLVECVTHDSELIRKLDFASLRSYHYHHTPCIDTLEGVKTSKSFIVSHPHGMCKKISFGNIFHYTVPRDFGFAASRIFQKDTTCYIPLTSDFESTFLSRVSTDRENEYIIPNGTMFTLPPDLKHVYRFGFPPKMRLSFPSNTIFTLPEGRDFGLPSETEFYSEGHNGLNRTDNCLHYLTYDVATCPGCSGAGIYYLGSSVKGMFHTHAGAFERDSNRSGLDRFVENILIEMQDRNFSVRKSWPPSAATYHEDT